jgi:hypothetical protein
MSGSIESDSPSTSTSIDIISLAPVALVAHRSVFFHAQGNGRPVGLKFAYAVEWNEKLSILSQAIRWGFVRRASISQQDERIESWAHPMVKVQPKVHAMCRDDFGGGESFGFWNMN